MKQYQVKEITDCISSFSILLLGHIWIFYGILGEDNWGLGIGIFYILLLMVWWIYSIGYAKAQKKKK